MITPTIVIADRVRQGSQILGDAVVVSGGRIVAVGSSDDLLRPDMVVERYRDSTIVGGLGDAHIHPTGYTAALTRLNLAGATDHDDIRRRVRMAADELPPGAPVIGTRVDDEHLAEGVMPGREVLDLDRPVLLYRYCGHVASANEPALESAGIGPRTADPAGGAIDRDESGVATGVLRETAIDLVAGAIGGRSSGQTPDQLNRALRGLVRQGLTRLGAIIRLGEGMWCGVGDELDLLCAAAPELPIDMSVFVIADDPGQLEAAAARLDAAGRRLSFAGLKVFADGSLGGHTAAMHEPFADAATVGTLRFVRDEVEPMARAALDLGGAVAVHAIGDRAVEEVVDFFADLRADHPEALLRMEHASVVSPRDVARLAEHRIVASVQPAFLASETDWLERRLGPERLLRTYAFRSLADAGVTLAGGSDCPVEPPDPLAGMALARHRAGIVPEQALSGAEALDLFTRGVTEALALPEPLAAGSRAHLTVLSDDPVADDGAPALEVVATWIDGASVPEEPDLLMWT